MDLGRWSLLSFGPEVRRAYGSSRFFFISSILGGISGKLSYQTRANCWWDSKDKLVLLHSPTSLVEAFFNLLHSKGHIWEQFRQA